MKRTAKAISTFLLISAASTATPQSEPLGRLFFTPEQRALLDRQRLTRSLSTGGASEESMAYTINGTIQRSNGRQTTWINGAPIDNATPFAAAQNAPLKAGETVRTDTGERKDLLNGGVIVIKPLPQKSGSK